MVTLRPPVKAALFSQPVHRVIPERGLAAVLVGQHGDAPGSVIPHAARQTALRGADGFTPRIILCLTAATLLSTEGAPHYPGMTHRHQLADTVVNGFSADPLQALQSESLITTGDPLSGIAAESLLTQYHDARAQKQNTDALEKQINERLEGVLSRWLLLKNNVMPEAATGTTAEK